MGDSAVQNPHDGFFKQTFGRVDFARGFLARFLAADVTRCIDLTKLQPAGD
jgi:hypothetical protein